MLKNVTKGEIIPIEWYDQLVGEHNEKVSLNDLKGKILDSETPEIELLNKNARVSDVVKKINELISVLSTQNILNVKEDNEK